MQPNTAMPNKFPGGANGGFGTEFQARQQSAKRYPAFERQSQKEKKHRLMRDLPIFGRSRPIFVCKRRAIGAIMSPHVTCLLQALAHPSPTSPYRDRYGAAFMFMHMYMLSYSMYVVPSPHTNPPASLPGLAGLPIADARTL